MGKEEGEREQERGKEGRRSRAHLPAILIFVTREAEELEESKDGMDAMGTRRAEAGLLARDSTQEDELMVVLRKNQQEAVSRR